MNARIVGLVAAVALLSSRPAVADAIAITSGSATFYWDGALSGFELIGDGTDITGEHHGVGTAGFHSGDTVVVHDALSPALSLIARPATVNGTFYPSIFLTGSLDFVGTPFVAPAAADGSTASFDAFFSMKGQLVGYSDLAHTDQLFSILVAGSGEAETGVYRAITDASGTLWVTRSGSDRFAFNAASPTPEPALLSLAAFGAAGLMAHCSRRRSGRRHTLPASR